MTNEFELRPVGPFSWAAAIDVLHHWAPVRRFLHGDGEVRLTFPLDGDFQPVAVALREHDGGLRGRVAGTTRIGAVARQVARMFSLDHDGSDFARVGERDPALAPIVRTLAGLRPVCFSSPYEAAAWAVLSQRISMEQAAALEERLLEAHGATVTLDGAQVRCFPPPDRLRRIASFPGLTAEKIVRLHAVADAARDGLLDADRLRALGDDRAPEALRTIRGIGPFWAAGIYLRAGGIVDVFPHEPRALAALGRLHGLGGQPDAATVARLTDAYRPFRMWVCFLLRVAAARELLPAEVSGQREATAPRPRRRAARAR